MVVEMEDEINIHLCSLHRMECGRTTLSEATRYSTITGIRSIETDERLISSMLAVEYSLVMPRKEVRLKRSPTGAFEGSRGRDDTWQ
jgi:hypothetical protein